ncbi:hypothetical protein Bhyg_04709 [Pseudolycoriella hygida]|uniref:Secreted protein n=1 Tax=Pseudolycoriella hygida TaxID=35572 RepID=A0A9Q0NFS1_9DIPT|nr:hypothetical protein Bhyg_04709 [Pseudolycoriella hygida]
MTNRVGKRLKSILLLIVSTYMHQHSGAIPYPKKHQHSGAIPYPRKHQQHRSAIPYPRNIKTVVQWNVEDPSNV